MFSPSRVRIVLSPDGFSALAASIASSIVSPGMNFTTERRTNFVRIARSRNHGLVDAHNNDFRITDIYRVTLSEWTASIEGRGSGLAYAIKTRPQLSSAFQFSTSNFKLLTSNFFLEPASWWHRQRFHRAAVAGVA